MKRREFVSGSVALLGSAAITSDANANVPTAYDWTSMPPLADRQTFVDWMVKSRGEDPLVCPL